MSGILSSLTGMLGNVGGMLKGALDRIFPPETRAEVLAKLQQFAVNNPKLAAFLTTQIALTGIPLLLFLTFSLTVFLFSLITALLIGLVAALLFTVFMVGVALLVVLPTIFMTTFAASFLFLWGLGGYYLLKWFNEGEAPAPEGTVIGDKLNSWTGGRMSWLTDGARKKQDDRATGVDQTPKTHGSDNDHVNGSTNGHTSGGASDIAKHAETAKDTATKQADGVQKRAGKGTDTAKTTGGTAKGAVGGATGT
ncbi:hypothetical protein BU26DRAFT_516282 [Trematosphaeria pertusa]|uniref:Uncharacterized protein n=1 Tax=Trematosphaeria pertusa TaxID=390896 RepID=A0A6A6IVT9_9PLEO|nr:uncharacterized protein BU26DRAFT_516282 [Trematosphaeria pertusa]KAF2254032.1 hypothetical protein BU26DRAFT_516282 [Trematosphaeria pertusa]